MVENVLRVAFRFLTFVLHFYLMPRRTVFNLLSPTFPTPLRGIKPEGSDALLFGNGKDKGVAALTTNYSFLLHGELLRDLPRSGLRK